MKKLITLLVVLTFYQLAIAQSPNAIPYQGIARNASGAVLGSQTISLRFSLHDGSATGSIIYRESHTTSTSPLGLFALNIGEGTPTLGTFSAINWGTGAKFLQVEMDAGGGAAFIDMGTTQMMSVPYALYAKIAGPTPGAVVYKGTWDAEHNVPDLVHMVSQAGDLYIVSNASPIPSQNTTLGGRNGYSIGDTVIYNGTIYQALQTTYNPIFTPNGDITATNVQGAIEEVRNDADTKLTAKVNRAGDTMTGNLVLNADPSSALGAATKQYVDAADTALQSSYIHKTDDGVAIYLAPGVTRKRFGIGDTAPQAPLGIKGEPGQDDKMICITSGDGTKKWNINLNPTPDASGFSIDDSTSGIGQSRLFIQHTSGNIGIGSVNPEQKLQIESTAPNGTTGIKIQNTASTKNRGYLYNHFQDGDIPSQDGRLAISELPLANPDGSNPAPAERLTIRAGGNVGINELIPDTKLHVSRPLSDPNAAIGLSEGTGIVTIGEKTQNIVADYRGIQARHGEYVGGTAAVITTTALNLQRLGGSILIHGDDSIDSSSKVVITPEGRLGLGILNPTEKIDIDGALKIGDTSNENQGTIRYTGTDFEGRKGDTWVSLTKGSGWEKVDNSTSSIYYLAGQEPRVGIGTNMPSSSLHVVNHENASTSSSALTVQSDATLSGTAADNRVGVQIVSSGTWSNNADAKNIGLYVSNVTGQTNKESNIAAVLNGNVVVGTIDSAKAIGSNGNNVLAIQNGTIPQTVTGTSGIQIYSANEASDAGSPPIPTLHIMNGNGDVIQLSKQSAMTPPSTTEPNTGNTATDELIANMRQRIDQLEGILKSLGILPPH